MIEFLRSFKFVYFFYNIFQKSRIHNAALLKKLGIKKWYFSAISSADFQNLPNPRVDLFSLDEKMLQKSRLYNETSETNQKSMLAFQDKGFAQIKSFLTSEDVAKINREIEHLIESKKIKFRYRNKIMFAIHYSELLKSVGKNAELIELLSILLQGNAQLFQSINFIYGSEQATHSDIIHMTTYPLGGLLGVWIALDDTNAQNGPLHYYPESHKLPYMLNKDFDNVGTAYRLGNKTYKDYETMMAKKIENLHLKKEVFYAQKGDLLIWHANLLHGGEPHTNKTKTRKSMVLHYFKKDVVCYHEISQRPSIMHPLN